MNICLCITIYIGASVRVCTNESMQVFMLLSSHAHCVTRLRADVLSSNSIPKTQTRFSGIYHV